ncbi:ATP-binding cassette domain-containing protein [Nocardiopsis sp. MG754419]|uniref:ATP-binding cassette domain-containing protein n=1 Tax=Nocardiopsis sp. MG754419 TaxID=2259865 RepID=UPI001BA9E20E|nr:ATP-binding cassette domain-containing protein [Nocardiopsis sp. MG754419]MBR8742126.1 daunorubicin/doxorubicin resistance ABC transporter ATP-binding protein DrrA [Nocardiopsis sp. MG754419]
MTRSTPAVRAEGLRKNHGGTAALAGLDLEVPAGTVFGLLGPNGAGKTTTIRVLATLLRPDSGYAEVCGHDVVRHAGRVRSRIGLTGQYASVDELLTGRENLVMFARLYGLATPRARARAEELLDRFDLTDAGDRRAGGYSGGMRRRLDLAVGLIQRPRVLFLDEPTTGLDPRSRLGVWGSVRDLVEAGTTVVLTTQYLEEADRLADRVAVIDHGRIIAEGTPDALRARVGGDRLDVIVREPSDLTTVSDLLRTALDTPITVHREEHRVSAAAPDRLSVLTLAVRALDGEAARIVDVGVRRPALDEVFLSLTGHAPTGSGSPERQPRS